MVLAYLDPAAGGMVIQMIVAAAVAVPFFLRAQIARAVDKVRGKRSPAQDSSSESSR